MQEGCDEEDGREEDEQIFARGSRDEQGGGDGSDRNDLPDMAKELAERGCPSLGPASMMNPNYSVWRDPEEAEDGD